MKQGTIINQRNGNIVSNQIHMANTWKKRLVGLLSRDEMQPGEALWLLPCKSIHTIGMKFPIDVVFLDKYDRIKKLDHSIMPYRFCRSMKGTRSVLELPVGSIAAAELKRGDRLLIR